ncbi:MAG: TMEM43 family protein, partial [Verrucomicrobiota bacterium]
GDIVGAGTGILAFAIALPLTLLTIAMAWLAYRPLIGIPLLLAAVGSVVFGIMKLAKSRKKKPVAA